MWPEDPAQVYLKPNFALKNVLPMQLGFFKYHSDVHKFTVQSKNHGILL